MHVTETKASLQRLQGGIAIYRTIFLCVRSICWGSAPDFGGTRALGMDALMTSLRENMQVILGLHADLNETRRQINSP